MPTKLWAVRTALTDRYTTTFSGSATEVFEGPRPSGNTPQQFVIVGATSSLVDESGIAARSAQQPSSLAGEWREEAGEIDCVAVAWSGELDLDPLRAIVAGLVSSCEAVLKADPQLGGLLEPKSYLAELTALQITEARTAKGPYVEAMFTVSYGTVLTS